MSKKLSIIALLLALIMFSNISVQCAELSSITNQTVNPSTQPADIKKTGSDEENKDPVLLEESGASQEPEQQEATQVDNNFYNNNQHLMNPEMQNNQDEATAEAQATDTTSKDSSAKDTIQTVTSSSGIPEEFEVEKFDSPYNVANNENESVSLNSGDLNYKYNILSLPGKNGFDLNLNLTYNSASALVSNNVYDNYYLDLQYPQPAFIPPNLDQLGVGWSLNLPKLSKSYAFYNQISDKSSLTLADGRSFKFYGNSFIDQYTADFTFSNNILTSKDGRVDVFNDDGNVISSTDKFGNTIQYTYKKVTYNMYSYADFPSDPNLIVYETNALDTITDSLGRLITFDYEIVSGENGQRIGAITVRQGDNIIYTKMTFKEVRSNYGYVNLLDKIGSIGDTGNYETKFEYQEKLSYIVSPEMRKSPQGSCFNLTKVLYYTGGMTQYTYASAKKSCHKTFNDYNLLDYWNLWYDAYKVSSRADYESAEEVSNPINEIRYYYERDNSGYPLSKPEYNGDISDASMLYYTIAETKVPSGDITKTIYTFNSKHQKISEESTDKKVTNYIPAKGYSVNKKSTFMNNNNFYQFNITRNIGSNGYPVGNVFFETASNSADSYSGYQYGFLGINPVEVPGSYDYNSQMIPYSCESYQVNNKIINFSYYVHSSFSPGLVKVDEYNISSDSWEHKNTFNRELSNSLGGNIKPVFANNKFWFLNENSSGYCSFAVYDPYATVNQWAEYSSNIIMANANPKVIAYDGYNSKIYLRLNEANGFSGGAPRFYQFDTNTVQWTMLQTTGFGGDKNFYLNGKIYAQTLGYGTDSMSVYNISTNQITSAAIDIPIVSLSGTLFSDSQGRICAYVPNEKTFGSVTYKKGIYRFNVNATTGQLSWEYIIETSFADANFKGNVFLGDNKIYSDHNSFFEMIDLSKLSTPYVREITKDTYDENYRLQNSETKMICGLNGQTTNSTQRWAYNYKGDLTSATDVLGNVTSYTYPSSNYKAIPDTITTTYANTSPVKNQTVTNTFSQDGRNIASATMEYSDGLVNKSEYFYEDESSPGNLTKEISYANRWLDEGTLSTLTKLNTVEYNYSTSESTSLNARKAYLTRKTLKDSTDGNSIVTNYDYYYENGLIKSETDPEGLRTSYSYNMNLFNWPTRIDYSDGTYKAYQYYTESYTYMSNSGNIVITTVPSSSSTAGYYGTCDYMDGLGRRIRTSEIDAELTQQVGELALGKTLANYQYYYNNNKLRAVSDAENYFTGYNYDVWGRVVSVAKGKDYAPDYNTSNSRSSVTYNDFNRSKTVYDGENNLHFYQYDVAGRLVSESGYRDKNNLNDSSTKTYAYNHLGKLKQTTDANGNITEYEYDGKGNLKTVTDALGEVTQYGYDSRGNLNSMETPKGSTIAKVYDDFGRLTEQTDQLGVSESFTYDKTGNVKNHTDRNGNTSTITYEYETTGSPDSYRIAQMATEGITVGYQYDLFGNVTQLTDSTGTTEYQYTYDNRLEHVITPDNKTLSYSYYNNGLMSGVEDYFGNEYSYYYDNANRLQTVKQDSTTLASYEYFKNDTLKKTTRGDGNYTDYAYNGFNQIASLQNKYANDSVINSYGYTYDLLGNQQTKTDNGAVTAYTYDELSRLATVQEPNNTKTEYAYDTNGNIMTKNITHAASDTYKFKDNGTEKTMAAISTDSINYTYDAANKLLQTRELLTNGGGDPLSTYEGVLEVLEQFNYDANGNMISRQKGGQIDEEEVGYTYDALNQMTAYTDPTGAVTGYTYDGNGLRSSSTTNSVTTNYYLMGDKVINESKDGGLNASASNIIGNGFVGRKNTGDENGIGYYMYNGHGDVTAVMQGETRVENYDYDAFGKQTTTDTSTFDNPIRYAGEYLDKESGLIYLRARYYDPGLSRFVSEDSYWNSGNMIYGDKEYKDGELKIPDMDSIIQSGNLYNYCMNNPVMLVDPSGSTYVVYTGQSSSYKFVTSNRQYNGSNRETTMSASYEKSYKTTLKGSFGVSSKVISAGIEVSVESSNTVSQTATITLLPGETGHIDIYIEYTTVYFDVYDDDGNYIKSGSYTFASGVYMDCYVE